MYKLTKNNKKTQIIKEPNQGKAMKRDSPCYGTQTWLIFNHPLMPTQQDWMIIKGIKYINSSLVITTQNKKTFLKRLFEKGFERD